MRTKLNFEDNSTKNLLAQLKFEFFLKLNIEEERYDQFDVDKLYKGFNQASQHIKQKSKENRAQFNLYSESQVRKMFTGGFLPSLFGLDESRSYRISDFISVGESWAYFNYWQRFQKRKITRDKAWNIIVKVGSILGIILSIIKFFEFYTTSSGNGLR